MASKPIRSPGCLESPQEKLLTHQARYGSPGVFPIVHLFKKKIPVRSITPTDVIPTSIRESLPLFNEFEDAVNQNSSGMFYDGHSNGFSTPNVLDALKEISRKRIQPDIPVQQYNISNIRQNNEIVTAEVHSPSSITKPTTPVTELPPVISAISASLSSALPSISYKRSSIVDLSHDAPKPKKHKNAETQTDQLAELQQLQSPATVPAVESQNDMRKSEEEEDSIVDEETPHGGYNIFKDEEFETAKRNKLAMLLSGFTEGSEPRKWTNGPLKLKPVIPSSHGKITNKSVSFALENEANSTVTTSEQSISEVSQLDTNVTISNPSLPVFSITSNQNKTNSPQPGANTTVTSSVGSSVLLSTGLGSSSAASSPSFSFHTLTSKSPPSSRQNTNQVSTTTTPNNVNITFTSTISTPHSVPALNFSAAPLVSSSALNFSPVLSSVTNFNSPSTNVGFSVANSSADVLKNASVPNVTISSCAPMSFPSFAPDKPLNTTIMFGALKPDSSSTLNPSNLFTSSNNLNPAFGPTFNLPNSTPLAGSTGESLKPNYLTSCTTPSTLNNATSAGTLVATSSVFTAPQILSTTNVEKPKGGFSFPLNVSSNFGTNASNKSVFGGTTSVPTNIFGANTTTTNVSSMFPATFTSKSGNTIEAPSIFGGNSFKPTDNKLIFGSKPTGNSNNEKPIFALKSNEPKFNFGENNPEKSFSFGENKSSFGEKQLPTNVFNVANKFNETSNSPATAAGVFGVPASTSANVFAFNTPNNVTSSSTFNGITPFTSPFGNTNTTSFATTTAPSFTTTNTPFATTVPSFNATASPFGATTTLAFGANTNSPFGSTTAPSFGVTTNPSFGTSATTSMPSFKTTTSVNSAQFGTNSPSGFSGFNSNTATPAFGTNTTTSFGSTPAGSPFTSAFGSNPSSFGISKPNTITSASSFGSFTSPTIVPTFGTTSFKNTANFGTPTTASFGTATNTFATTTASSLGTTPSFGVTTVPSFGATTAPLFGTTTASSFGATTAPSFGTTTAPSFGATTAPSFGATTAPSFGATATPSFGATTTPSFGATTTPSFGATTAPSFGSTSSFATATSSPFATPNQTPSFGAGNSTPSFGVPSQFTSPSTPSFGATTIPNPFNTIAAVPSFPNPGGFNAPSNMFSIGSGSTGPKARTHLRGRRRT